jgi:predicted nucleotidyltransferase
LQRGTLERKELYDRILSKVKEALDGRLEAVIVFGSSIYLGQGEDIDLIIVVNGSLSIRDKLELEYKLKRLLEKAIPGTIFDVHVFDREGFRENLKPGTVLSGLALGYRVIYGGEKVEPLIIEFLKQLSKEKYILHNRYGTWNLSLHAKILYKLKTRKPIPAQHLHASEDNSS